MDNAEYERTKGRRRLRKRYLYSRLPRRCTVCGSHEFELHHKSYDHYGYELLKTEIVPLCRKHHKEVHGIEA